MRASIQLWSTIAPVVTTITAVGISGDDRFRALFSSLSYATTLRSHVSTISQLPLNWHLPKLPTKNESTESPRKSAVLRGPTPELDRALYEQLKECAKPGSTIVVFTETERVNFLAKCNFRVIGPIEEITDMVARHHILQGHYTLVERLPIRTEQGEIEFKVVLVTGQQDPLYSTERYAFLDAFIAASMAVAHQGRGYDDLPTPLQNVVVINDEDDGYRLWTNKEFYIREGATGKLGVTCGYTRSSNWLQVTVADCALHHEASSRYQKQ